MIENKKPEVLVLVGPTASGKTALGIALAKALNGEIVSADSMQIYKYMSIGTAKVTIAEMDGVPHHLVDCILPDEEFSVAKFKEAALTWIHDILSRGKLPIVVGGTGLYINGLTLPWGFREKDEDEVVRWQLAAEAEMLGCEALFERLKEVDPKTAQTVHPNNVKRVIRALEIFEVTGKPKSFFDEKASTEELPYTYEIIGLKWPRDVLYERINRRVDNMVTKGLIKEAQDLLERGYSWSLVSLKAIGYKELRPYLEGKATLEEMLTILKQNTRHFAKRQMTWFRKDDRIHWVEANEERDVNDLTNECLDILKNSCFMDLTKQ
ncbi:tRNA (adenosine(37)-N6)-dimethylallyltransferase MiaA [Acetobacterium bakii]|uniref:tRNA dimethylallyltransferase n=1 Tax=Acetobacterium bakii TaxID=52689 RepID=A0A0L6U0T7_9FIRM|nr:tRNA (adenosine(37)-N6)-dimethylallyltransferase MiaA [Acetobacterium bakii]KNZ42136.1 tRNA delta(2)-isopentenylpyrophosphate transferase [Acetobacterium bakii]